MLRTLTLLSAAILATHVSHTAMAQEVSSNDVVQPPASANVESADQSNHFQTTSNTKLGNFVFDPVLVASCNA